MFVDFLKQLGINTNAVIDNIADVVFKEAGLQFTFIFYVAKMNSRHF